MTATTLPHPEDLTDAALRRMVNATAVENGMATRPSRKTDFARTRRISLGTCVMGGLGAAVIATTLFGVRLWARLTRTPYYDD